MTNNVNLSSHETSDAFQLSDCWGLRCTGSPALFNHLLFHTFSFGKPRHHRRSRSLDSRRRKARRGRHHRDPTIGLGLEYRDCHCLDPEAALQICSRAYLKPLPVVVEDTENLTTKWPTAIATILLPSNAAPRASAQHRYIQSSDSVQTNRTK